jgi:hypothetical protein
MSFDVGFDFSSAMTATTTIAPLASRPRPQPALECHDRASASRAELEDFVREEFHAHFGAAVTQFMPELVALRSSTRTLRAVVGCRAAARERLFLESYTREPIEEVLARHTGFGIARERIVEIGSLACRTAGGAVAIVQALVPHLLSSGFSWVVFTGASTVMNVFRHLGLAPLPLCPADPLLLGEARHAWGTYYDHSPHVMAGRIANGALARPCPRTALVTQ